MKPEVYLIAAGPGSRETMTLEARQAAAACPVLLGAPRLLEAWREEGKQCLPLIAAGDIAAQIAQIREGPVGVLLSGDAGFFSGAAPLRSLLEGYRVRTFPGVSSLSYLCARLGQSWQDVRIVSAHGRSHNAAGEIQCHERTFVLTGGQTRAEDICKELAARGLGRVEIWVGERLSYPEERIVSGTAEELAGERFDSLAVLLARNPRPVARPYAAPALEDGDFARGEVPMTKGEIRALVLSRLHLEADSVVWDVGAGTGSVSVECALACPAGRVFAVERDPRALELIGENAARHGATNLTAVAGAAPAALAGLPAPDRVFLGGTGGSMEEILGAVFAKNPAARVVCTALTLETVAQAARLFAPLAGADMVQISVTRTRRAGPYHLMDGQNPVWIFSGEGRS